MTSIWYRLLRRGTMPPTLAAAAKGGNVLVAEEGLSIRIDTRGLRLPGRYTSRGVRLHVGSVVLTGDRLLLAFGRQVVLDAAHGTTRSPVSLQQQDDGLHLHIDLAEAVPDAKGTLDIAVRTANRVGIAATRYLTPSVAELSAFARFA